MLNPKIIALMGKTYCDATHAARLLAENNGDLDKAAAQFDNELELFKQGKITFDQDKNVVVKG